jgi:hypothetical protein
MVYATSFIFEIDGKFIMTKSQVNFILIPIYSTN